MMALLHEFNIELMQYIDNWKEIQSSEWFIFPDHLLHVTYSSFLGACGDFSWPYIVTLQFITAKP